MANPLAGLSGYGYERYPDGAVAAPDRDSGGGRGDREWTCRRLRDRAADAASRRSGSSTRLRGRPQRLEARWQLARRQRHGPAVAAPGRDARPTNGDRGAERLRGGRGQASRACRPRSTRRSCARCCATASVRYSPIRRTSIRWPRCSAPRSQRQHTRPSGNNAGLGGPGEARICRSRSSQGEHLCGGRSFRAGTRSHLPRALALRGRHDHQRVRRAGRLANGRHRHRCCSAHPPTTSRQRLPRLGCRSATSISWSTPTATWIIWAATPR